MRQAALFSRAAMLACALLAASAAATAQTSDDRNVDPATATKQAAEIARGDPARWYREDVNSAARRRTREKEIGAALQEARNDCRKQAAATRGECLQQARSVWQQDMTAARQTDAGVAR